MFSNKFCKSFYFLIFLTLINLIIIDIWIIHQNIKVDDHQFLKFDKNLNANETVVTNGDVFDQLNKSFFKTSKNWLNFENNGQHLLWFMNNGFLKPDPDNQLFSQLALWPDQSNDKNDRIVNQLMYIPYKYDKKKLIQEKKFKKILLPSGFDNNEIQIGRKKFEQCPVSTCELIIDRSQEDNVDAIFFTRAHEIQKHKRKLNQIWILYFLESPFHTPDINAADGLINWTATYRHDSDIVTPYEKFVLYNENVKVAHQNKDYSQGKTKKVAWFVSNCGTLNKREDYVKELSKYIDVDIYGSCGNKKCSKLNGLKCFQKLEREYKFYLAFENSNCKDYITEKFFNNALRYNVIPIVLGANIEDYQRVSPFNSYIHVNNFDSPQSLAEYLKFLDTHQHLYNLYFQWKNTGEFVNTFFWCRLCAMLHAPIRYKSYKKLHDWWKGSNICKTY